MLSRPRALSKGPCQVTEVTRPHGSTPAVRPSGWCHSVGVHFAGLNVTAQTADPLTPGTG